MQTENKNLREVQRHVQFLFEKPRHIAFEGAKVLVRKVLHTLREEDIESSSIIPTKEREKDCRESVRGRVEV